MGTRCQLSINATEFKGFQSSARDGKMVGHLRGNFCKKKPHKNTSLIFLEFRIRTLFCYVKFNFLFLFIKITLLNINLEANAEHETHAFILKNCRIRTLF